MSDSPDSQAKAAEKQAQQAEQRAELSRAFRTFGRQVLHKIATDLLEATKPVEGEAVDVDQPMDAAEIATKVEAFFNRTVRQRLDNGPQA